MKVTAYCWEIVCHEGDAKPRGLVQSVDDTADSAARRAWDAASYYAADAPAGTGYAVSCVSHSTCGECFGRREIRAKPRKLYAMKRCPSCKGRN